MKNIKTKITAVILFILAFAVQLLCFKYFPQSSFAFAAAMTVQLVFVFTLASYDRMWGFCAYASYAIALRFLLQMNYNMLFILCVVSTVLALVVMHIMKRVELGNAMTVSCALLLKYVALHYSIKYLFTFDAADSSVYPPFVGNVHTMYGLPYLAAVLISVLLIILIIPAVNVLRGRLSPVDEVTDGEVEEADDPQSLNESETDASDTDGVNE